MEEITEKGNQNSTVEETMFLVQNRVRETKDLCFVSGEKINLSSDKFLDKLSITVSAIANGDGGKIYIGISSKRRRAEKIQACSISGISEKILLHELNSRIDGKISDLEIEIVPGFPDESKGIVIIKVPEGRKHPFQSYDKRFYKRQNFKDVPMDESEIRVLYNKTNVSEIEFFGLTNSNGIPTLHNGKFEKVSFYPRLLVRNISSTIEKSYKLEFSFPASLYDESFSAMQRFLSRHDGENLVFSIPGNAPLFQEEIATVFEAKLVLTKENYKAFANGKAIIRLFYSSGIRTHEFKLSETLLYNYKNIRESDFS